MGTLATWSRTLLWLGFLLEAGLLVLLIRNRLAKQARVFPGLLLFYAVRSVLLYGLASHMSREASAGVYSGLSLVDLLLQVALGCELLMRVVRPGVRRVGSVFAALAASLCVTAAVSSLLPLRSPVAADRGTIFTGTLYVIVFGIATMEGTGLRRWRRALMAGLAASGCFGAVAECGKSFAAAHHDGRGYVAWSYGNSLLYLLTLTYWIAASRRRDHPVQEGVEPAGDYARGTI